MHRIEMNGDYLIVAPKKESGYGFHKMFTERTFLVTNLLNFIQAHPEITQDQITIYELKEINDET